MKKLAIASASLALAAMPVVGVFAADEGSPSIVDNVTVVINESCTFQATADDGSTDGSAVTPSGNPAAVNRNFRKSATLGALVTLGGDPADSEESGSTDSHPITIEGVCNSGDTSGGGSTKTGTWTISALGADQAKMVKEGSNAADKDNIPAGTATSGTASAWQMKIDVPSNPGTDYSSFQPVPATTTAVATGTANGSSFSFQPSYQVYVGTEQASGTYTGKVTYTIASVWQ